MANKTTKNIQKKPFGPVARKGIFRDGGDKATRGWMQGADGGGGMISCSAHPSRPLTGHRICSIAEGGN